MELRKCRSCGRELPNSHFECINPTRGWYRRQCKDCILKRNQGYVEISKQRIREYNREYYSKNKERIDALNKEWKQKNPDRRKTTSLYHYYALQHDAVMAYGGYRCNWCGIDEPLVLAIDHVNNDGKEHRKQLGTLGGQKLYKWLKDNGYPDGFQVLCMNCNHAKYRNKGVIPDTLKGRCNDQRETSYIQADGSARTPTGV